MLKSTKQIEKLISNIEDAKIYFEELQSRQQDTFDNRSEKWQETDKGLEFEEDIRSLEELAGDCENLIDSINNLFEAD